MLSLQTAADGVQGIDQFLASLHKKGIRIWTQGGQIHFRSPRGQLNPDELDAIRSRKREIIDFLERSKQTEEIPLEPRERGSVVPLNPVQLMAWRHIKGTQGGLSDRACYTATHVLGDLDVDVLRKSLDAILQRHESLRTTIVECNGVISQRIDSSGQCSLEVIDLSGWSVAEQKDEVLRRGQELVREKVDLSVGPLFLPRLFKLSAREHVLVLAMEHIISDDASSVLLRKEVWTLYDQAARNQPLVLPALPVQFADYVIWQQRTYATWLRTHESYWRSYLAGAPSVKFPLKASQESEPNSNFKVSEIYLGLALSNALRDVSRREKVLLPLVVLGVYVIMAAHWCRQRDLVVSFAWNARNRSELVNMIGFIASILYLRVEISGSESFIDLARRLNAELWSACTHHDYCRVMEMIPMRTDLYFNWMTLDKEPQFIGAGEGREGLQIRSFPLMVPRRSNFAPFFFDTQDGIVILVSHREDVFAPGDLKLLSGNIRLIAEMFSRDSKTCVDSALVALLQKDAASGVNGISEER